MRAQFQNGNMKPRAAWVVVGERWGSPHECCWRTHAPKTQDRECNRDFTSTILGVRPVDKTMHYIVLQLGDSLSA